MMLTTSTSTRRRRAMLHRMRSRTGSRSTTHRRMRRCRMLNRRRPAHRTRCTARTRRTARMRGTAHMCRTGRRMTHRRRMRKTTRRVGRMISRCPGYRRIRRPPMIHSCILIPVLARRPLMLQLSRGGRYMMLISRLRFRRRRPGIHPAGTSIVGNPATAFMDHCPVNISVVYNSRIDMGHRRIIPEMPTDPAATGITYTSISKSIINPAIEPDMWSPIPAMPAINTTCISPVSRRP